MDVRATVQRWGDQARRVDVWVLDGLLATIFVVGGLGSVWNGPPAGSEAVTEPRDALSVALVLLITVPYYFRRHAPLAVLVVSTVGLGLLVGLDYYEGMMPVVLLFGAYTVGSWCPPRQVIAGAVFFGAALLAVYLSHAPALDLSAFATNLAFYTASFVIGWSMQSRRLRLVALEERAAALEREHEEVSRRAVADERLHIAQELHDVVAHSMGVIAVQAGVGLHVIDADPAEARRALEAISTTSRSTLGEIRRLLGVLRDEGESAAYSPAPGLDELGRLAADVTEAGVAVELDVRGDLDGVPHGVELTAYRIVQEALTNVLKHAGPASARVVVAAEPGALQVEILDDGRGVNGRSDGTGHGLMGMRERVAVYGGDLVTGVRASGGFRVFARLPYDNGRASDRPTTEQPASAEANG
jgi:signal transduction histidine kinase